jgi:hypothetical protein
MMIAIGQVYRASHNAKYVGTITGWDENKKRWLIRIGARPKDNHITDSTLKKNIADGDAILIGKDKRFIKNNVPELVGFIPTVSRLEGVE